MEKKIERSHRSIKPETFGEVEIKVQDKYLIERTGRDKPMDSFTPSFRQKTTIKYRAVKIFIKDRVNRMFTKQTEKVIRKKLPDDTLWGKIAFGLLDAVSLPQMHEVWKAVEKELPSGTLKQKMKLYWKKIDGVRTLVSVAVSVATAYYIIQ